MRLDSLQEATRLRDMRARADQVVTLMRAGNGAHLTVLHQDKVYDTFDLLSPQLLRGAVAMIALEEIERIDNRLRAIGVDMPARTTEAGDQSVEALSRELSATRRDLDMYRNAWLRSLGGKVMPKAHLIDALVLTTERMAAKASKFSENPAVSKAEHDRRVTELLEFNNSAEQRARDAERKLREFMSGTPAERLAFAVSQSAAETIAGIRRDAS